MKSRGIESTRSTAENMMQRNDTTTAGQRYQLSIVRNTLSVRFVLQKGELFRQFWFITKSRLPKEERTGQKTYRHFAAAVMEKYMQTVETGGTEHHPWGYLNLYGLGPVGTGAGACVNKRHNQRGNKDPRAI